MRRKFLRLFLGLVILAGLLGGLLGAGFVMNQNNAQGLLSTDKVNPGKSPVTDVVEKTSPAVVSVATSSPQGKRAIGSGFIISPNGTVITSAHVVNNPNLTYYVVTDNKGEYPVENISRDTQNDIAVLSISAHNLPTLKLGNSNNIRQGEEVITIGTPFGTLENTVTVGVVSGVNREIITSDPEDHTKQKLDNLIQIDAAINPGNSGGPLINLAGEAIGINSAGNEQADNIGFAVPVNKVKDFLSGK